MLVFHPVFHLSSYILPRDPPRKAQVQQTAEQNCPTQDCCVLIVFILFCSATDKRASGSAVILSSVLRYVSTLHRANVWGPKHVT